MTYHIKYVLVVAPPINERELRISHDPVCHGNGREAASPTCSKLTHYYNRLKEREGGREREGEREGEGGRERERWGDGLRERERKRRKKREKEREREREITDKCMNIYAIIPVSMHWCTNYNLVGILVQKLNSYSVNGRLLVDL